MRHPVRVRRTLLALVATLALPATAHGAGAYTTCPEDPDVDVARVACDVALVAADAARESAGDDLRELRRAGWLPLSARDRRGRAEVVAVRRTAVLRYRRDGEPPDALAAAAGRELVFSSRALVGGAPVRGEAAFCTSGFTVRSAGAFRMLTAGHCAADERSGRLVRRYSALRRAPLPGVPLGTVFRSLYPRTSLDAALLRTLPDRGAAPFVWRSDTRPPWAVVGAARALPGREVCMSGRTSGPDRCGRVAGRSGAAAARLLRELIGARVTCTTIRARQGDSGGPVYTKPRADGTTFALGTATLVIGQRSRLCFTPIAPVLDAVDGRLLVAPR
jgi:hypothetical protein